MGRVPIFFDKQQKPFPGKRIFAGIRIVNRTLVVGLALQRRIDELELSISSPGSCLNQTVEPGQPLK